MFEKIITRCFLLIMVISIVAGCRKEEIPPHVFELVTTEFNMPAAGGEIAVKVRTNGLCNVTVPDSEKYWLRTVSGSGTGAGTVADPSVVSEYVYSFKVMQNDAYDPRSAKITVTDVDEGRTYEVAVSQMQVNALFVSKNEFSFDFFRQEFELLLSSNVDVNVDIPVEWIHVTKTKALEVQKLAVVVDENTGEEQREAVLKFSYEDLEQTVKISQLGFSNPMILELKHNEKMLNSPLWKGENLGGTIFWGDGTEETYAEGISHEFAGTSEAVTTSFDMYRVTSFEIPVVGSISTITISCK